MSQLLINALVVVLVELLDNIDEQIFIVLCNGVNDMYNILGFAVTLLICTIEAFNIETQKSGD